MQVLPVVCAQKKSPPIPLSLSWTQHIADAAAGIASGCVRLARYADDVGTYRHFHILSVRAMHSMLNVL